MFYLNRYNNNRYYVTDSSDNVEECLSHYELICAIRQLEKFGESILGCHLSNDGYVIVDKVYKKNNLYVFCLEHGLQNVLAEYADSSVDICSLSLSSNKKVQWKCKKCGGVWEQSPNIKFKRGTNGCPYCGGLRVLKGYNDLATLRPDLVLDWDFNKNVIKPDEVTTGSSKVVWWRCHICSCSWKACIATRTRSGRELLGCPDCATARSTSGTSVPEIQVFTELSKLFTCKHRVHLDKCEFDILCEDYKFAVEYDGYVWHKDKFKRDLYKNGVLENNGYILFRIRDVGLLPVLSSNCVNLMLENYSSLGDAISDLIKFIIKLCNVG